MYRNRLTRTIFPALLTSILWDGMSLAVSKGADEPSVDVNWSMMRVRFHGEAGGSALSGENYQTTTERALQDGLSRLVRSFPEAFAQSLGREVTGADREIAHRIASSTYIAHAEYFANGDVKVDLESNLARALAAGSEKFRKAQVENLPMINTALVIQLDQASHPLLAYEIVDAATGEVLFQKADVAQEEYEKNLMGRWFIGSRSREYRTYVGSQPVTIEARLIDGGKLQVARQQWDTATQSNPGLLELAKLAIVTPSK
ncbi:MAG: hypothetical protein ACOH5I_05130 [Oligoflexus sp.]